MNLYIVGTTPTTPTKTPPFYGFYFYFWVSINLLELINSLVLKIEFMESINLIYPNLTCNKPQFSLWKYARFRLRSYMPNNLNIHMEGKINYQFVWVNFGCYFLIWWGSWHFCVVVVSSLYFFFQIQSRVLIISFLLTQSNKLFFLFLRIKTVFHNLVTKHHFISKNIKNCY